MTYTSWTDGVSPLTAADLAALQDQGVPPFATTAARTTAIPVPIRDQLTSIQATNSLERWTGSAWEVVYATPIKVAFSSTPPVTTDASLSDTLATFTVPAGSYRVRGLIRVTAGTCKVTSSGSSITGFWGNATNGEDAAAFDRTSADAIVAQAQGINVIDGAITASAATTWTLYDFYRTSSAVIESGSFVQLERTA